MTVHQMPNRVQHHKTPMDIENRLLELSGLIDQAHSALEAAEADYHRAKAEFEVAYARAFMSADERNAEACKQQAVLDTREEKQRLAITEATVRAARANVNKLRDQVDITRSVGRLVTSSMNL